MARGVATTEKIRQLVVKHYCGGKKLRQIAEILDIPKSTVADIVKLYGETGNFNIKGKSTGRPRIVKERDRRFLVKCCDKNRRGTLREITSIWNDETGLNLSRECCRKWIHKSGLSFYKVNFP